MTYTADFIRDKIITDDRWALRGLVAIYNRQTEQEKFAQATIEHNGVGFSGVDGKILTSIAEFYISRKYVTPKQMVIVRNKMKKYAGQLAKIANA